MRLTLIPLAMGVFLSSSFDGHAENQQGDFEVSFLSSNYSAIRFPSARVVRAGDILHPRTYRRFDSVANCMTPEEWHRRYGRDDTPFQLTSTNESRSGRIEADVRTAFFGAGVDVVVQVASQIGDDGSLNVQSDDVRIETARASQVISDEHPCQVYRDVYAHGYAEWMTDREFIVVDQAFFFGGNVEHSYLLSLQGSGEGSIRGDRISQFLDSVSFLRGLSGLFHFQGEVRIGGEAKQSTSTRFAYGDGSRRAVGFIPLAIRSSDAREVVSLIEDQEDGRGILLEAANDPESANMFLERFPVFDIHEPEAIVVNIFGGEGLTLYDLFREEEHEISVKFADVFSRILEINLVAGREL